MRILKTAALIAASIMISTAAMASHQATDNGGNQTGGHTKSEIKDGSYYGGGSVAGDSNYAGKSVDKRKAAQYGPQRPGETTQQMLARNAEATRAQNRLTAANRYGGSWALFVSGPHYFGTAAEQAKAKSEAQERHAKVTNCGNCGGGGGSSSSAARPANGEGVAPNFNPMR